MSTAKTQYPAHNDDIHSILDEASKVIVGKEEEIRLCLIAILSSGHVLLEGAPGLGKTSLIKTLAKLTGLNTNRIQFTNDLLPADILGASIYSKENENFRFHKGPIFSNFILADEINRATPKTQSACLQAMEEHKVNIDGQTYDLPQPFYVFATQNPSDNIGTFPLPESQLDRFFMRIAIGLPDRSAEREILKGKDRSTMIETLKPAISYEKLIALKKQVEQIHASEAIYDYLLDLVEKSRSLADGLSPRASQDFLLAAKANAFIDARDFVIPEDLQRTGIAIMNHRLGQSFGSVMTRGTEVAKQIIDSVSIA